MAESFRPWDVYVKSRKLGLLQDADYELDAPGTIQQAADGAVGRSTGPVVSKVSANVVRTVGGRQAHHDLREALLGNIPVTLTLGPEEGKLLTFKEAWCHNIKGKADFKDGTCTGSFSFESTAPKAT